MFCVGYQETETYVTGPEHVVESKPANPTPLPDLQAPSIRLAHPAVLIKHNTVAWFRDDTYRIRRRQTYLAGVGKNE